MSSTYSESRRRMPIAMAFLATVLLLAACTVTTSNGRGDAQGPRAAPPLGNATATAHTDPNTVPSRPRAAEPPLPQHVGYSHLDSRSNDRDGRQGREGRDCYDKMGRASLACTRRH